MTTTEICEYITDLEKKYRYACAHRQEALEIFQHLLFTNAIVDDAEDKINDWINKVPHLADNLAHGSWKMPSADSPALLDFISRYKEPKKIMKMAPVVLRSNMGIFRISYRLHSSEEDARNEFGDSFAKWLIDTPYAIELEI